jgi:EF-hand domain pair
MKTETGKTKTLFVALLLGVALLPAYAADLPPSKKGAYEAGVDFKAHDTDKDGYLSMEEFLAKGKDDLAFRAADIDGDGRVDRSEYAKYVEAQATDQPGSGAAEQPQPAVPSAP